MKNSKQRREESIQDIIRMAEDKRIQVQSEINSNPISIDRTCFEKKIKERQVIAEVKSEQNKLFKNERIALITL